MGGTGRLRVASVWISRLDCRAGMPVSLQGPQETPGTDVPVGSLKQLFIWNCSCWGPDCTSPVAPQETRAAACDSASPVPSHQRPVLGWLCCSFLPYLPRLWTLQHPGALGRHVHPFPFPTCMHCTGDLTAHASLDIRTQATQEVMSPSRVSPVNLPLV